MTPTQLLLPHSRALVLAAALTACSGAPPRAAAPPTERPAEARQDTAADGSQNGESDTPRVLHLRDERFGIEFDAPDDSWLAIGPRVTGNGVQFVWIWSDGNRQIDVQALDLSVAPAGPPDQASFASHMAARMRTEGSRVGILEASLAGARCHHLVIDREDGLLQDMFILHRGNTNYMILVTQRARDLDLLDRVRAAFRLTKL